MVGSSKDRELDSVDGSSPAKVAARARVARVTL